MENRFLTLTFFPCCNLPLCSYPQTLRINLFPFFSSCALRRSSPVFPLSYHRTLPRRLPTGISKLSSDCWFRISYDITKYQFDQIPKEYCVLSQNTKYQRSLLSWHLLPSHGSNANTLWLWSNTHMSHGFPPLLGSI